MAELFDLAVPFFFFHVCVLPELLTTTAGSKKEKKKAKKLKRHMSLNVHQDKLPPMCNNEEVTLNCKDPAAAAAAAACRKVF